MSMTVIHRQVLGPDNLHIEYDTHRVRVRVYPSLIDPRCLADATAFDVVVLLLNQILDFVNRKDTDIATRRSPHIERHPVDANISYSCFYATGIKHQGADYNV
jgi:hypothetical protein